MSFKNAARKTSRGVFIPPMRIRVNLQLYHTYLKDLSFETNSFISDNGFSENAHPLEKAMAPPAHLRLLRGEWPTGLYSLRQVTEVKVGRVRSNSGWVTSEA